MKSLSKFLAFALVIFGVNTVSAQGSLRDDEAKKAAEVKELVNSGRYTFKATKQISQKGGSRALNQGGDLDVAKDTIIMYLPDVGKSPMTPIKARDAGITCTHFAYNMTTAKNGSWIISIKPEEKYVKDIRDIKKINMDISREGYATLTVAFTNKSPIAFYGYIQQHSAVFPPVNAAVK
jgi:hypothetical protein